MRVKITGLLLLACGLTLAGCHKTLRKVDHLTPPPTHLEGARDIASFHDAPTTPPPHNAQTPTTAFTETTPYRDGMLHRILGFGSATGRVFMAFAMATKDVASYSAAKRKAQGQPPLVSAHLPGDGPALSWNNPDPDGLSLGAISDATTMLDQNAWLNYQLESSLPEDGWENWTLFRRSFKNHFNKKPAGKTRTVLTPRYQGPTENLKPATRRQKARIEKPIAAQSGASLPAVTAW